jgi:hypothetical protein
VEVSHENGTIGYLVSWSLAIYRYPLALILWSAKSVQLGMLGATMNVRQ